MECLVCAIADFCNRLWCLYVVLRSERNGKGDRQKSPAKDNAEVHPFIKGGLFAPYRVKYNLTYNAK